MGLPKIIISLSKKASTLVKRSSRGVVVLLLKDDTNDDITTAVYTSADDAGISADNWTAANIDYIKKAFLGSPAKVICERIGATTGEQTYTLEAALKRLSVTKFNYLAMPAAATGDGTAISDWIKTQRSAKRYCKAVLANCEANDFGVINFTTEGIMVGTKSYSTAEYTARLAGIFAGISLDRSATYFVLDEVTSITSSTTPDTDVDNGELILINDFEKIKIGRAVNSKKTLAAGEIADMKKIKLTEAADMIKEDISTTFADEYVGKVGNSYDNKVAFCAAINSYLKDITSEGVLYDKFDNSVSVDVVAQAAYLKSQGVDTSEMSDEEIKNYNTGSQVFIGGNIQFQDAMEDLTLALSM